VARSRPAVQQALAARDGARLQAVLDREASTDLLLAVTGPDGRLLAQAGRTQPSFLPGVAAPGPAALLGPRPAGEGLAMLQRRTVTVDRPTCPKRVKPCALGMVTAGVWMDNQELQRLAMGTPEADLTVAVGGRPVASTLGRLTGADQVPEADGFARRQLAGRPVVESAEPLTPTPGERARLLVSVPATATTAGIDSRLLAVVVLLLVVVCLVATALGAVLARLVSQPLGELAEQARAIARGDFARPPSAVRSGGEVGELARAFERMRVELGRHLAALRTSRDELARSMNRLGETRSSTHDLPKLLAVVLEAAVQPAGPVPPACCCSPPTAPPWSARPPTACASVTRPSGSRSARASPARSPYRPPDGPGQPRRGRAPQPRRADRHHPGQRAAAGPGPRPRRPQPLRPRGRRAVHPGRRRGALRGQAAGPRPGGGGQAAAAALAARQGPLQGRAARVE
jgi:HAMP domain-containing protein